jgi:hypothetical protein
LTILYLTADAITTAMIAGRGEDLCTRAKLRFVDAGR